LVDRHSDPDHPFVDVIFSPLTAYLKPADSAAAFGSKIVSPTAGQATFANPEIPAHRKYGGRYPRLRIHDKIGYRSDSFTLAVIHQHTNELDTGQNASVWLRAQQLFLELRRGPTRKSNTMAVRGASIEAPTLTFRGCHFSICYSF